MRYIHFVIAFCDCIHFPLMYQILKSYYQDWSYHGF